ncbi:hypothetical protein C8Q76DRAFT_804373 [Earliella scabrosa]|nr:hypothetical protein C8Q76DRAFT_804373 [Earliella scabrosa]
MLIDVQAKYKPPGRTRADAQEDIKQFDLPLNRVGGFLTDFEFASSMRRVTDDETVEDITDKQPGDGLTGTAIFVATDVLRAAVKNEPISRTVGQDLESICYAILYAVYKHGMDALKGSQRKPLEEEFRRLFVATSLEELIVARRNALGVDGGLEGLEYLGTYADRRSPALSTFIVGIWLLVQQCQPLKEPEPGSSLPLMRQKYAKKVNKAPRTVKPPTHEEVISEIKELLEGLGQETETQADQ